MPYRIKSGNQWMGQVVINGRKVARKRFKNRKEALEWEISEKAVILSEPKEKIRTISLLEWATAYLHYAEKRFVEKTFDEKKYEFKMFFQSVDPGRNIESLRSVDILGHLQRMNDDRSGNAANKARKNLRAAWLWGIHFLGLPVIENPFDKVLRFAEERHNRHVPTMEDFLKVYNLIGNDQDKLLLMMYLQTGARREELFRMQWKDVDMKGKRLAIRCRKNNVGEWKENYLPITDDLADMLRAHRKTTGLLGHVFMHKTDDGQMVPYVYRNKWLPLLCQKAGVERFGFHGIRHLFASVLAGNNVPLVEIQKMLRHESINTTARYIHSLEEGSRDVLNYVPMVEKRKSPQETHTGEGDEFLVGSISL